MTKEDINKLLAGRAIVEGIQKADAKALAEKQATLQSVSMVKTAAVTELKKEVDAIKEAEAQSILHAVDEIKKLGFGSIGEFMKFNDACCLEVLVECRPIQGKCDLCKGNLDKDGKETGPVCINVYGIKGCQSPDTIDVSNPLVAGFIHSISLKRMQQYGVESYKVEGDIEQSSVCPKGHGFYVDRRLCKPFPFNTAWRAPHTIGLDDTFVNAIREKYKDGAVKIATEEKK